ncbi:MAG: GAF domain-containing protein [Leptospirales bacterium]|nr:GAF domain-containing protein [Leptospirales bacterium]
MARPSERRNTVRRAVDGSSSAQIRQLEAENSRLKSLLGVSKEMMSEVHLDKLLELIMHRVTSVMNAERSSLFLLDHKTDELYAQVAQGLNTKQVRFPNGKGIAGHVGKTGETINIKDAYQDPRFNRDFDRKSGFRTRSILCMPIRNTRKKIIGVAQVLNKKEESAIFTRDDESLLQAFSSIAAISLENAFAYDTISRTMQTFEKFVPPRYLSSIAREGLESIRVGNVEQVDVSVLFSDIRNFTTLAEKMKPHDVLQFLNEYLKRMSIAISKHNGFVDKFIGDAIMAIFETGHPGAAVRAGIDMLRALTVYNRELKKKNIPPIGIGIGIHFGSAVLGTVGSETRMDSTVLGDTVNLSARMEGLTKMYGCPLMVTESVATRVGNSFQLREVDTVRVKGKDKPIRIYEVYDQDAPALKKLKTKSKTALHSGIASYKKKDWAKALSYFEPAHRAFRKDTVLTMYIARCKKYMQEGVEPDWDGSVKLYEK